MFRAAEKGMRPRRALTGCVARVYADRSALTRQVLLQFDIYAIAEIEAARAQDFQARNYQIRRV